MKATRVIILLAAVLGITAMAQAQVVVVKNIAALKALPVGKWLEVNTLGYYTAGDGGHSSYRWNSSSTDADDGGMTIASNGGGTGRWKLLYDGSVRIRQYGAKGDAVTDDQPAINRAHTAMTVSGGEILFTRGTYKVGSDITFNSNVTVRMREGASFTGSRTLRFSGFFDAGLYKVFDLGTTAFFHNGGVEAAHPEWWGAVGNGTANDSVAVQRAINSVILSPPSLEGSKVVFTGLYGVNQKIQVINAMGLEITGSGTSTGLVWIGTTSPSAIVFETSNIYYCKFQNFIIDANNKAGIGHYIYNYNSGGPTYPIGTHENYFNELLNTGSTQIALKIGNAYLDMQIDWLYFTNCHFGGAGTLVKVTGSNTFHILFQGGEANDFTGVGYDLVSGGQVYIKDVGWQRGGAPGGAPLGTYVRRSASFGALTIENVTMEGNTLILEAPDDSGSANYAPVVMSGNTFGYTGATGTGCKLVDYRQRGPFISHGDRYGANPNGSALAQLYFSVPGATGLVLVNGLDIKDTEVEVVSVGNTLVTGFSKQGIFTVGERIYLGNRVPRAIGEYVSSFQIEKAGHAATQSISTQVPDPQGSVLTFHKSRGTVLGDNTIVQNGDTIGKLAFAASDGSDPNGHVASIAAMVDGTPGINDLPGSLVFSTTRDGENGPSESLRLTRDGDVKTTGNVSLTTAGKGLRIKEGANARMGVATLVAGSKTVANTSVTANTRIFISRSTGSGTLGHLRYTISPGVSFTVTSSSGTDTSTFNWLLIEPE